MTRTILVADDQVDNRIIFATILEYGGYRVLHASDGIEAVAVAQLHRPALILMDLSMPRMDGWAAVAELQRDPATAGIPVLAISAHGGGGELEREARRVGCIGYLAKPIEPRALLRAVQNSLGGPDPGSRMAPPLPDPAG